MSLQMPHGAPLEALNYFAKLFRVVLAELALTIGIVSQGRDIFIVKTLEMSQGLRMAKFI